jgi:hypothetical protein
MASFVDALRNHACEKYIDSVIDIDIFVNCNWADTRWQEYSAHLVDTRWQEYSAHLHTNNT